MDYHDMATQMQRDQAASARIQDVQLRDRALALAISMPTNPTSPADIINTAEMIVEYLMGQTTGTAIIKAMAKAVEAPRPVRRAAFKNTPKNASKKARK